MKSCFERSVFSVTLLHRVVDLLTLIFYTAEVLEFFQPITKICYFRNYTNYIIVGGVKITIKGAKYYTRIFRIKKNPVAIALILFDSCVKSEMVLLICFDV